MEFSFESKRFVITQKRQVRTAFSLSQCIVAPKVEMPLEIGFPNYFCFGLYYFMARYRAFESGWGVNVLNFRNKPMHSKNFH
jgi:hypothetical protein